MSFLRLSPSGRRWNRCAWSCARNSAAPRKRSSRWLKTQLLSLNRYAMMSVQVIQKPAAFLINISRGDIGDEQALAVALKEGRLGGAALDVLTAEPLPPDHPLQQAPNMILTPHLAFYSRESVIELQTKAAEEVARALKGEPPRCPVNADVLAS
jgi:D-3-phosphoglycerate dehydrogenase / 2-oxoglutarate reductase